ncbi:MAG TPA: S8 family serine peptidase [Xenococcaceae cyanobacterium]
MDNLANTTLNQAISEAQHLLTTFGTSPQAPVLLPTIFGDTLDTAGVISWLQNHSNALLPQIEIRLASEINYANGAYGSDTNTIYLAEEFLVANANKINAVSQVIIEELGHFLDHQFNPTDGTGDEGELFAAYVRGANLSPEAIANIQTENDTVAVELDGQLINLEQANVGDNNAFDLIGLTQLRNDPQFAGIDGSGLAVAVIDSGIQTSHPLLQENYLVGVDFINGDSDPDDVVGHGTHVSGTIGARDETIGVAPDVGLIGLKVGERQQVSGQAIIEALQWVLDNHEQYNIVAVNMSLGGGFFTSESEAIGDPRIDLVNRLEQEGVTVVAAAGNSYQFKDRNNGIPNEVPNLGAPSIYSTLSVGAVWQDGNDPFGYFINDQEPGADRVAVFSQRLNANNFILAPGALINSTYIDADGFELLPGTSMASPHVAGAVALLQEAALQFGGRRLTPEEVAEILRSTADTVEDGDDENDVVANTGLTFPRLNIYNAIVELKRRFEGIAPPPPPPNDDPGENPNPDGRTVTGDPNGTITGAIIGPTLNGEPVEPIFGVIGTDGGDRAFVGETDVDLFRFEVESPGTVAIALGTAEAEPNDFDTYLRLFDAEGNEIAFNDDLETGVNAFSRIEAELAPGTYYTGVSGFDNSSYDPNVAGSGVAGATGNYSLQFNLTNSDPNGLVSGAETVDLGNDREPLVFPGLIGADYGASVGVSDVDLYRIIVPDNGTLFVDIDTPFADDEFVDSFLRLFDAEGNELVFASSGEPFESDDDLSFNAAGNFTEFADESSNLVLESPDQTNLVNGAFDENENYVKGNYGHSTDSFLGVIVEKGEVYHIGVSDFFNRDYNPQNLNDRPETGAGGLYEMIVTFVNNDLNGSITQVNTITELPGLTSQENIGVDNEVEVGNRDVDFWKLNSAEAGILEIDIDSTAVDTVALLFDGDGNLIAENDDNDGLDPLLQYQVAPDTDYYLAVTGYGNENFDPFGLGTGSGGDTGAYTINGGLLPSDRVNFLSDNKIDNESIREIAIGDRLSGDIGDDRGLVLGAEDIDLYRFVAANDGTVNIRASADEAFSADTFLRVFDTEGNELAFNNNESPQTRGSFISQEVTANTEYIIGVNGNSDRAREYDPITGNNTAPGSRGSYTLSVTDNNGNGNPGSGDILDLYRFRNTSFDTGTYVFVGAAERDAIQNDPSLNQTFVLEGDGNPAFRASTEPAEGLLPFFRLRSLAIPGTFLFVGNEEYDAIFAEDSNQRDKWAKEGFDNADNDIPEFYLYGAGAKEGLPFNRFQNNTNNTFLFAGPGETEAINNDPNLAAAFTNQGVAFGSF